MLTLFLTLLEVILTNAVALTLLSICLNSFVPERVSQVLFNKARTFSGPLLLVHLLRASIDVVVVLTIVRLKLLTKSPHRRCWTDRLKKVLVYFFNYRTFKMVVII